MNSSDTCKQPLSNGARKKLSWSALRFCHRRNATIACPGDVLHAQKTKKRNDDEAHPGTGTTSGHSRRRMQPNQKHNDTANRVLAVNFNQVCNLFFTSPHDASAGVHLELGEGLPPFWFAKVDLVIGDGAALAACWSLKGASGTKPCFYCQNVFLHGLNLHLHDSSGRLVSRVECDVFKLALETDEYSELRKNVEGQFWRRLWSLLCNFYPPPSLCDRRRNEVNPLLLALQSAEGGAVHTADDFSMFSILLAARCDPNVQVEARQSPLLHAMGIRQGGG